MRHQSRTSRLLLGSASAAAICTLAFVAPAMAQTAAAGDATVEGIVVTARRAAIESATERKKNADSIIDSVVADDAGKLPDNSITEILQRVSGVSIVRFASLGDPDHFSAEGSGLQVRGLSGVAGRLNGREIFSSAGGRGLSWGDVTPELMAAVDVYKSSTADLIEGGTGGQIDLRTKMPFDFRQKQSFGVTLNGSYGDLARQTDGGGSVLLSRRWDTGIGEIGVVVDLAYNKFSSHSDFLRMEPYYKTRIGANDRFIPGGYTFGNEDFERTRTGAYLALAWRPNDDLEIYGTAFTSKYESASQGQGRFVTSADLAADTAPGATEYDSDGGLIRSSRLFVRNNNTFLPSGANINAGGNTGVSNGQSVTSDFTVGFKWSSGQWGVKGALQAVDSSSDRNSYDAFLNAPFPTEFGVDLSGDFPQITLPGTAAALFANRALYSWTATQPHNEHNKGHLYAANIDAEYVFEDDGFFKSVKFGARAADRNERDQNNGYNWAALGAGWNGAPVHNAIENPGPYPTNYNGSRPGDTMLATFDNYFRGDAQLPGVTLLPSYAMVARMDRVGDHTFYGNLGGIQQVLYTPQQLTTNRTSNQAVYAMVKFATDLPIKLSGNAGVRLVKVQNESTGFYTQPSATTVVIDGVTRTTPLNAGGILREDGLSYTKVLPSINLLYQPTETIRLRMAANITLDNASFNALRASGNVGFTTNAGATPTDPRILVGYTTTSGNPRLKPMMSNNLDLTAEYYPSRRTTAHVSLFYKKLEDVLLYAPSRALVPVTFSTPTAETIMVTALSTDTINSPVDANIKGFEIGGRTFFDQLPAPFNGFGIEANYTYIDSENPGDRYFDINGIERYDVPISGLSRDNFNVTLLYEKEKLSARLAYSWRSEYLMGTNANGTNGSYNYRSTTGTPGSSGGPAGSCPTAPAPAGATCSFNDISLPNYADDYGSLDAGVTYRVNSHISVSLEGSNLTNEVTNTLMGGYNNGRKYIRSWFVSDRRTNLSIRVSY